MTWFRANINGKRVAVQSDTNGITNEEVHLHSNGTSSVNLDLDVAFLTFQATAGSITTPEKVS